LILTISVTKTPPNQHQIDLLPNSEENNYLDIFCVTLHLYVVLLMAKNHEMTKNATFSMIYKSP